MTRLAERQAGVVRRGQLHQLVPDATGLIAANVIAERWTMVGSRVVLMQNAPPSRDQQLWIAVLHSGDAQGRGAALAGLTALEADGLEGFAVEPIHVVVERGRHVPAMPGLIVHESRRFDPQHDPHPMRTPPRTRLPRSVIDAAAWESNPRRSAALLAASVQQRLTTTAHLFQALAAAGRVDHSPLMRLVLHDIAGGAHSLGELDIGRLCRRGGLRAPDRQRQRTDAHGRRRYLDCEWRLSDGRTVVLEVDGAQHIQVRAWWDDMKRERAVVISGKTVLRCGTIELRLEPDHIIRDLRLVGVPRVAPRAA